jgi:hypothetical protein
MRPARAGYLREGTSEVPNAGGPPAGRGLPVAPFDELSGTALQGGPTGENSVADRSGSYPSVRSASIVWIRRVRRAGPRAASAATS